MMLRNFDWSRSFVGLPYSSRVIRAPVLPGASGFPNKKFLLTLRVAMKWPALLGVGSFSSRIIFQKFINLTILVKYLNSIISSPF